LEVLEQYCCVRAVTLAPKKKTFRECPQIRRASELAILNTI
jgi:hypothetical protein